LPTDLPENEYEDIRHLIVGGWVNALSYHLMEDYKCSVIFVTQNNEPYPEIDKTLDDDVIYLISIMSGNFQQAKQVIRYIRRKNRNAQIMVGGVHPTLCTDETFELLQPDYLVIGEADEIIKDLISHAVKRQPFFQDGIWNRNFGKPSVVQKMCSPNNFEWSWDLHNKYSHDLNKNIVNYVNTRSCPYNCYFCGIVKTKYSEMPPQKVISQIEDLVNSQDNVWVHWETPCCFYDTKVAEEILKGIKPYNINLAAQHRVEDPTSERRKIYKLAYKAGLTNLFVGIESVQDNVLKRMNKQNKSHLVEPFLKALNDEGITVNSGWLIGIPGQTADDVRRDMEAAVNLVEKGLMAVALPQYLEVYPGTWFWNNAEQLGITMHCDNQSYDRITKEIAHSTKELSKDEIWELYVEFMNAVATVIK
jgi:radical SAM superfamily enzyme YgiQ (UPF0313 family)